MKWILRASLLTAMIGFMGCADDAADDDVDATRGPAAVSTDSGVDDFDNLDNLDGEDDIDNVDADDLDDDEVDHTDVQEVE